MNITIEIVTALFFGLMGYASVILYLNKANIGKISLRLFGVNSLNRIVYLLSAAVSSIVLICLFNLLYYNNTLVHNLKLLVLVLLILPMAVIDYRFQKIPNEFILAAFAVRCLFYIVEFIISPASALTVLKDNILGAVVIGIFFMLLLLIFKNSIGMGDIKLFMIMGLYQGLWGVINSIFFSLMVSFVIAVVLLITHKKKRNDVISFGPSIFIGTILAIGLSGI